MTETQPKQNDRAHPAEGCGGRALLGSPSNSVRYTAVIHNRNMPRCGLRSPILSLLQKQRGARGPENGVRIRRLRTLWLFSVVVNRGYFHRAIMISPRYQKAADKGFPRASPRNRSTRNLCVAVRLRRFGLSLKLARSCIHSPR